MIVTAGNTVIGVAGKHQQLANTVNGAVPAATPVTATVTRVLTKTGQTLVNLGNGNSMILNKAGGAVGDVVKIDLGSQTVIGAPSGSPLLGVGVLPPTGSGNVATISSSALPASGTVSNVVNTVGAVTAPVSTVASGVTSGVTGTVSPITTPVTSTVSAVTAPISTVTGSVTAGAGAGGSITTPITTVTGGAGSGASVTTSVTNTAGSLTGGLTGALKKK